MPHAQGVHLCPGTGPGEDAQGPARRYAFDAAALVLARRLIAAVAEVPVRAQQGPGSRVRVLLVGRCVLAEVWAVRRAMGGDADATAPFSGAIQQGCAVVSTRVGSAPRHPGAGAWTGVDHP
jgi:hypothetical protein